MIKNWFKNGSQILFQRQATILSAAAVISVMVAASRILGLVRNRILAHYFSVNDLSLYFAAFRVPEVIFEVLVFGSLSSAFIPTFTAYLSRHKKAEAWHIANASMNLALLFFSLFSIAMFIFSPAVYRVIAAGFNSEQLSLIVPMARILLLAQGFFVLSYFLTGILESLQRFLVPAIAPLFYNLGIILGAIFLSPRWGIYAPVIGAVLGAFCHFLIQLPAAFHLGFRFKKTFDYRNPGVRRIGRLALPRMVELSFLEVSKSVELFLASFISTAAYTYYTFATSLQLLPVSLFGMSIAKASLPTLSRQASLKNMEEYKRIFLSSFNEIIFLVLPTAFFLAILRIPLVRLAFGTSRFTWVSTVETGYTVSAFCVGIFAQALIYLLTRAFYALHDTATPVKISIASLLLYNCLGVILIMGFHGPIWQLAFSYSVTSIIQVIILTLLLDKKIIGFPGKKIILSFSKTLFASLAAGGVMFFLLKVLDFSVWNKKLSFLSRWGFTLPASFDRIVLDTRYTGNLIILTIVVTLIGVLVYLLLAWLLKLEAVRIFSRILGKIRRTELPPSAPISQPETEIITEETV